MVEPLTPPDCDLRDFAFMPLDVVRLRDSDIAALTSGDEFRCAVLLWCASWHQVPAASLPDDDVILAKLAGFGRVVREWQKLREGALRGWIKCSDGRLYHPVVAEKAHDAWNERQQYRTRKAKRIAAAKAAAEARWQSDGQCETHDEAMRNASNTDAQRMPNAPNEDAQRMPNASPTTCRKGQGQGQGQGNPHSPPLRSASRGRRKASDPPALPDWLDLQAWEQWDRYRGSRKGWTVDAKALSLRKLGELRAAGNDPQSVIEQSILNGWAGLFPLKAGPRGGARGAEGSPEPWAGAK